MFSDAFSNFAANGLKIDKSLMLVIFQDSWVLKAKHVENFRQRIVSQLGLLDLLSCYVKVVYVKFTRL